MRVVEDNTMTVVEVIENSNHEEYEEVLQKYLNEGFKIVWCDIKENGPYKYKAILIMDNKKIIQ